MKVKIKNDCVPVDNLLSVEQYAQKTGYTRANIYYHIREKNIETVKIGNNTFVIDKDFSIDNQQDT